MVDRVPSLYMPRRLAAARLAARNVTQAVVDRSMCVPRRNGNCLYIEDLAEDCAISNTSSIKILQFCNEHEGVNDVTTQNSEFGHKS